MSNTSVQLAVAFVGIIIAGAASSPVCLADDAGEAVFRKYCSVCHSIEPGRNKLGPSLSGVVGRKSAAVERFDYSQPLRALNTTWTPEMLDQWLAAPGKMVPGTRMTFPGLPNKSERDSLIDYLEKAPR